MPSLSEHLLICVREGNPKKSLLFMFAKKKEVASIVAVIHIRQISCAVDFVVMVFSGNLGLHELETIG